MQLRARVEGGQDAIHLRAPCQPEVASRAGTAGFIPRITPLARGLAFILSVLTCSAHAQAPLTVGAAAQLAAQNAPTVNPGTLVAFAYHESRLHPWAVHDNTSTRTYLPLTLAGAITLASSLLSQGDNLDLGVMQVNSANLARTGLTVATAFDAGTSMRAGAMILAAAYQQCLHGGAGVAQAEQQSALRCAASVYNTGREQAGLLNGYQAHVWRVAAQIVPAIQIAGAGANPEAPAAPERAATPEPHRPPPGLEDALHASPPVPDEQNGLGDALNHTTRKENP